MDLHFDLLNRAGPVLTVALAHYFKMNGDMVADPDMELRVHLDTEQVEAVAYQDQFRYQIVYDDDGMPDMQLARQLDVFLQTWLMNLAQQGHTLRRGA